MNRQIKRGFNKSVKTVTKGFNQASRRIQDVGEKLFTGKLGYSPKVLSILKKYGNTPIISITIWRTPVNSGLVTALNVTSFGEFSKRFRKQDYDQLYHLGLCVVLSNNVSVMMEKNEIINLELRPKKKKETETKVIANIPEGLTMMNMLENARNIMGDTKFFRYSASSANCQDFCIGLIKGSNLDTPDIMDFVKQDTRELFEGLTGLRKLSNTVTDMGRYGQVIMQGGEIKRNIDLLLEILDETETEFLEAKMTNNELQENIKEMILMLKQIRHDNDCSEAEYNFALDKIISVRNKYRRFRVGGTVSKVPKQSPWIMFVKQYAMKNGLSYKDALKEASKEYKK